MPEKTLDKDLQQEHTTVLLDEAVAALEIQPQGIYIDATFGRGGHSRLILSKLGEQGKLIAFDRDLRAVKEAQSINDSRFTIIHAEFSEMENELSALGLLGKVNGILFDLGVSSPQLDDAERGFSFTRNGPLDMRMNDNAGMNARDWLLKANANEISDVLWKYGEERFSRRIAQLLVEKRQEAITNLELDEFLLTTFSLVDIIRKAVPFVDKNKHPATRSFQAIRIFINQELDELETTLEASKKILAGDGKLSVISFHSLEDRIVKNFMRENSQGEKFPAGLPLTEEQRQSLQKSIFFKKVDKAVKASKEEVQHNIRSRSAILRACRRC